MSEHNRKMIPIAIVGVSALFPGSIDAQGFWTDILAGRDLITEVPPTHWLVEDYYDPDPSAPDKTYCKRGAFLPTVDFDPMEFGVPPSIMPATDTSQLLALVVAQKVLEDASQGQFASMDRERISVVLGVTSGQQLLNQMVSRLQRPIWLKALRESGIPEVDAQGICDRIARNYTPWQESSFPGLLGNVVAGRIANRFDLHGTNAVTDAACASSMAAISMGINELQLGQSDLVISGGVDTMNDIFMYLCFSKTPALSPTEDCRPFSDKADGTLLGEGIGMMALKRLADAERDSDRVYAVIRGIGSASDGRSKSVYAPLAEGQIRALRRAYAVAGYGPETVELLEAHGTGTTAGDAAEFEALRVVFTETDRTDTEWCALGSVKSQIGHTKAAAGVAGLFKAVMALHHKVLPPTIKIERPNPALEIERSPFYLNTEARPWIRSAAHARRASVSSFGFGGSNFHVTLEEYVPAAGKGRTAWRFRTSPTELVLLSSPTTTDLITRCRMIVEKSGDLVQVARDSQKCFDVTGGARLAVVAVSPADLADKLNHVVAAIAKAPDAPFATPTGINYAPGAANPGGIAFLFPGQGSQYVGMGADVAMSIDAARATWDRAAAICPDGESIHRVVFPPPAFTDDVREAQTRNLTATEYAQVALGIHGIALVNTLYAIGVRPQCVAGHSFGEVTALHAAGAFDEPTLIKIARRRGELMRDASVVSGAMTAVACPIDEVHAALNGLGDRVVVANYNAPSQCVLSGATEAIALVEEALSAKGITSKRLAVATAFHSPLVASSSAPLRAYLSGLAITAPLIDVYGTADAAVYQRDPRTVRERLAAQIAEPVRFVDQIEAMYRRGIRTFIEVGPGSVLTELVGRILNDREHCVVSLDRKGSHGLTSLQRALGRLAVAGVAMDLQSLWAGYAPVSDKPAKKPAMAISVSGASYAKPYPPPGGAKDLPPPNPLPAVSMKSPTSVSAVVMTSPEVQQAWVRAYQDAQRHTADAHAAYQRAMADSHLAFLKTAEASFEGLTALLNSPDSTGVAPLPGLAVPDPAPPSTERVVAPLVATTPTPASPVNEEASTPPTLVPPDPLPIAASVIDLEALLMDIVSEKTGYPAEMLGTQMELESDLGIDSIKRVEILSAMSERLPGLRDVKMAELAGLRTLGEIVEYMRAQEKGISFPETGADNSTTEEIAASTHDIQRFALREAAAPAVGIALSGILAAAHVVITDEGAGLADALVTQLAKRGLRASIVSNVPPNADVVIFLGGMRPVANVDEAVAVNREAFRAARSLAARFSTRTGGVFVTVQDTGGDFGISGRDATRAWLGGISGLARTAALEWPGASVKTIDCERGGRDLASIAEAICTELFEGGPTLEVGLRADGQRTTLASVVTPVPGAALPRLGPESVVVASGGARGVTAAGLIALAQTCHPRIVLLGRTPLDAEPEALRGVNDAQDISRALVARAQSEARIAVPAEISAQKAQVLASREVRETLDALAAAGSPARYVAVDVKDTGAVASALDTVRREWGPITAIIHGAGVVADKCIADKTDEQFDRVFDTKVAGLRALLAATAADPLNTLCLFSSVAARTGNPGQCDYAMANEVLNLVACAERSRRGSACTVRSIGWGPWEGGMVTPALKTHFQQMGVALIPLEVGAKMLVDELAGTGDDVTLIIAGANGHGPLGANASVNARVEVRVDARSHSYLDDHRIDGVAVVPVAMAVEWMLRGARAYRPNLTFITVRNLRVLSGIKLDQFEEAGNLFVVNCRQTAEGNKAEILMELCGESGTLHYSAMVEMDAQAPPATQAPPAPELERWPHAKIYDGHVLFHRERFQVIKTLEGVSRAGIAGTLAGAGEVAWPPEPWCIDPALLDGGLQLAVLWTHHVLHGASLPMMLKELRVYRSGPAKGPVRCVIHGRRIEASRAVCDISFSDASGALIAQIIGVETILRYSEPASASPRIPAQV